MRISAFGSFVVALVALVAIGAAPAEAQGNQSYQQRWFFASDFGQWAVRGQQANTYQWSPGTVCNVSANGSATGFLAFNTDAPVEIIDATPANNEVVTPTSVTQNASFCTIAVSPAHNHYSFQMVSGTGGLQEALNSISPTRSVPAIVWLDPNWYALANAVPATTPATIVGAATGEITAILVDNTTAPFTNYIWGGTAYAAGTWVNTAPTAATGAATGTATSKVLTGTALTGTYSFTTGTATTGTVFTLTWGLNTSTTTAQFNYAPTCTVVPTPGSTIPPTLTIATTYPSSTHALLTVSVASALTSTTAYSFQWACH
jgi:hypothetical protein